MRVLLVCDRPDGEGDSVGAHARALRDALIRSGAEVVLGSAVPPDDSAFDVVHAHADAASTAAYAGVRRATAMRVPTVLTVHALPLHSPLLFAATEVVLRWSRTMVLSAVNSVLAAELCRWTPELSVGILPLGVDAGSWRLAVSRRAKEAVHVVAALPAAGSAAPARELVRTFAEARRFVAGDPRLALSVMADERLRDVVRRCATESGMADSVSFAGSPDAPARLELFADADVFVDGGAEQTMLEARAAGLPIVAMLRSAARDVVTPGLHGLLARDAAELSRHIARLALEEPLRQHIVKRNRTTLPANDWSLVVPLHLALYEAAAALVDRPLADSQP